MPRSSRSSRGGSLATLKKDGRAGRPWLAVSLAVLLCLLATTHALLGVAGSQPRVSLDDAFITLIYARSFAETGDFIYNAIDGTVDGFTSLLDVVVKAGVLKIFPAVPIAASIAVTFLYHGSLLLTGCLLALGLSRNLGRWRPVIVTAMMAALACSPHLTEASATGLESPLFVLLVLLSIYLTPAPDDTRRTRHMAWALCVFLTPLARPEGLLVALFVMAGAFFSLRKTKADFLSRVVLLGLLSAFFVYYGWRFFKWGHLAPNTYFAKTSDSRLLELADGFGYVIGFARRSWMNAASLVALLAAPILLLTKWSSAAARRRFALVTSCGIGLLVAVIWSGGDCYRASGRFLVVPMTLLLFATLEAACHLQSRVSGLAAALLMLFAVWPLPESIQKYERAREAMARGTNLVTRSGPVGCVREASQRLSALFPKASVAQSDLQMFKFFAPEHHVTDLHGMSSRSIAHQVRQSRVTFGKFSQENGIRANADLYLYGFRFWSLTPMSQFSMEQILGDSRIYAQYIGYQQGPDWPEEERLTQDQAQRLAMRYVPASLAVCGRYFNFFVRKGLSPRPEGKDLQR